MFFLSLHPLHTLLQVSDKLLTRFDNELDINLRLSTNSSLHVIVFSLLSSLLTGTEKVIDFF